MWIFECYAIITGALVVILKVPTGGERMILRMLVLCVCLEAMFAILEARKIKRMSTHKLILYLDMLKRVLILKSNAKKKLFE